MRLRYIENKVKYAQNVLTTMRNGIICIYRIYFNTQTNKLIVPSINYRESNKIVSFVLYSTIGPDIEYQYNKAVYSIISRSSDLYSFHTHNTFKTTLEISDVSECINKLRIIEIDIK